MRVLTKIAGYSGASDMRGRILVTTTLTAGLLAAAGSGVAGAGVAGAGVAGATQAAPGPARPQVSTAWLSGVSATSATNALAVGSYGAPSGIATLIEHWNGKTWTPVPTGPGPDQGAETLSGVAATSAGNAWASGEISTQYSFPLVLHWHGGKKMGQDETPTPGGDGGAAYLGGVGAASATDAWAVGGYLPELSATDTLILRWTGKKWVQAPSPSPGGNSGTSFSVLGGVAAVSPADAWAVGDFGTGQPSAPVMTLIEHWNGHKWVTVPSPDPTRTGCAADDATDELSAVAASPAGVWAVGSYCGASLTLRLENGTWQQVPSPAPAAGVSERLTSVTVTSATNAWAVGQAGSKLLILHWNGTKWATASAPSPAGASKTLLTGVSAVSASVAWAVGEADYPHNVRKLLFEQWTGTRWKLVPVRNPYR